MKYFLFFLFPTLLLSQNNILSAEQNLFAMFYNVENLFDTINNPFKNDDRIIIDLMSSKYEKNEAVSLILHDIFGRVIFDRSFLFIDFPFEINTVISNQLDNGIYFVNLYVDGQIITRKILKQ